MPKPRPIIESQQQSTILDLVHWNVRSIQGKFKEQVTFDELSKLLTNKPDIISLVETHLERKIN